MNAIYKLTLDLNRSGVHDVVRVKLHDTMRELHMFVKNGSDAYHISGGVRAVLSAKKSDGNVIFNSCEVAGDMVIYRFTGQETAVAGVTECELRLYDGDIVICSARFEILVDETSVDDEEILSLPEATELTRLMHHSEEALAKLHEIFGQNITPVSYAPQSLTLEQAAQARENIMAPGKQDFDELERVVDQLDQHFLSLDPQELTEEQQLQLRANINAVSSEALARLMEAVNESFGELEEQVIKNTAQSLTPEQMEQARKNIGAKGTAEVQDAVNDAIDDAMSNAVQIVPQTLTEAEKAQARRNLGAISAQEVAELVPVDATLKNAGQAADAAAVGRALGGLRFEVDPADGGLVIHYGEEEDDGND